MEFEAGKMIGMGIAMLALFGVAGALGNLFASYMDAVARNPGTQPKLQTMTFIGMALIEALGLFALVIAFMMLGYAPAGH